MRTPWPPGLACLEQPQAVLQVGDQTWEPFSFWLTSSMNASGRFLPFFARLSCLEDHVPLLLALTKRSHFGLLLLVSTRHKVWQCSKNSIFTKLFKAMKIMKQRHSKYIAKLPKLPTNSHNSCSRIILVLSI